MRRISSRDLRYVVAFAAVATVVTSIAAYAVLSPPPQERFFSMWILGSEGLAERYYPNDDPNLGIGEKINWTLSAYNHMGSLQYVVIRVKLLNSTVASPDDLSGTPSPASPLFEFTRVLEDNETWSMPFNWTIESLSQEGSRLQITGLSVDQFHLEGELVAASSGYNYRFVFELWFYDLTSNDLTFSGRANTMRPVWTQVWFNATATASAQ